MERAKWEERRSRSVVSRHGDGRTPFDRDLARVIHSAAFRRLQSKTQVLGLGDSDFYRTRLTHSVEVAQIAAGIVRTLTKQAEGKNEQSEALPSVSLITGIALAHDIGHPPFGHGGEAALNYMMRENGGFEGNAQTLRILTNLESRTENNGLNLTRRTLLGVLKYPAPYGEVKREVDPESNNASGLIESYRTVRAKDWKPPKCYFNEDRDLIDWVLEPFEASDKDKFTSVTEQKPDAGQDHETLHKKTQHVALDTSIMNLADDISYGVHDLEDAIHMKLITRSDWEKWTSDIMSELDRNWLKRFELQDIDNRLFGAKKWEVKNAIGALIKAFIAAIDIQEECNFSHPLLRMRAKIDTEADKLLAQMKKLVVVEVIKSPQVQTLEYRGQQIVIELFQALSSDPHRLLPSDTVGKLEGRNNGETLRVITDHISGMTDEYATKIYERLFVPRQGSVFQKM